MHRLSKALGASVGKALIALLTVTWLAAAPTRAAAPEDDAAVDVPGLEEEIPPETAPEAPTDPVDAPAETEKPGETEAEAEAEAAPAASTEKTLEQSIRVIQPRPILKNDRLQVLLGGGLVASDTMFEHYFATGTLRFHISEWVSVAATYEHYFSQASDLYTDVTTDFELFPEISRTEWYAGADLSVMPIDGKFVFFDSAIVYFEIYASLGGGVTKTSRGDSLKPTGVVGVGFRMFLSDWLSLDIELRDHLFFEDFDAGTEVVNNVTGTIGLGFFIPFGFDYSYPR